MECTRKKKYKATSHQHQHDILRCVVICSLPARKSRIKRRELKKQILKIH